jgi:Tfp pilus assembly protein PilX
MPRTSSLKPDERGSVLIIAVIGMLIMGVLAVSFSLLSNIEANIGLNYKSEAQAEAVAEAGLDWARDQVRGAGGSGVGSGFSNWFNGTNASHMLTSGAGQSLGGFTFNVRIDNDCSTANTVPSTIEEAGGCDNTTDKNETAVLTSWATVGSGRARVRAVITIDNPWKHVCSNSKNDPGGSLCNSAGNTKGNPTVIPADTQDPNGPRGFSALPRPIIGCSQIDPTVHRMTAGSCSALGGSGLFSQPGITNYPAYPSTGTAKQLVLMGESPVLTSTAKSCGQDGSGVKYFGYFDCALRTPCPASVCGSVRKGCIRDATDPDSGGTAAAASYFRLGTDGSSCGSNTGMVFLGSQDFTTDIGSTTTAYTIYVMHDAPSPGTGDVPTATDHAPGHTFYGTLVVEGNVSYLTKSVICTGGPAPSNPPASFTSNCGSATGSAYGYPLALLSYDPKLAYPTVSPQAPQPITTNFGTPNAVINGQVYSGGSVSFNPINVNGATVGFNIDLQASSSTYQYVPDYGIASPPPSFPPGASDPVVLTPKTFIVCNGYHDDSSGATSCQ